MNDFQNIIGSFTMTYFGNENLICYIYILKALVLYICNMLILINTAQH